MFMDSLQISYNKWKKNPNNTLTFEEWKKNNPYLSYNFKHDDDYLDEIKDWDVTLSDGLEDDDYRDDV